MLLFSPLHNVIYTRLCATKNVSFRYRFYLQSVQPKIMPNKLFGLHVCACVGLERSRPPPLCLETNLLCRFVVFFRDVAWLKI